MIEDVTAVEDGCYDEVECETNDATMLDEGMKP